MSSMQEIIGSAAWYVMCLAVIILLVGELSMTFFSLLYWRSRKGLGLYLLIFAASFVLFIILMNCFSFSGFIHSEYSAPHRDFEFLLVSLPWGIYAGAELILALLFAVLLRNEMLYLRTHLTTNSIREAVDTLPSAVSISETNGTVRLVNLQMDRLSKELTGGLLSDAGALWDHIVKSGEDRNGQYLIHLSSGEVWIFSKDKKIIKGQEYDQIIGSDMTEQYKITEELSAKNVHLREVQYRLKEVSARERSLVALREIMKARVTVHNQMGNVLLTGKYYLDHPENVDESELLRLLEYNNMLLIDEAEQPESTPDILADTVRGAARIGVNVIFKGSVPESEPARSLIALAIDQCATNAVRHAGGDQLTVQIHEEAVTEATDKPDGEIPAAKIIAVFTNNGEAPKAPIKETGGLASLRRIVEAAGGSMIVTSRPEFMLVLEI